MIRKIFFFLLLFIGLGLNINANGHKPEDINMVHLQDRSKYACNPDNVLSDTAVARIDSTLSWLEANKGIQTILVVVKKMNEADSYNFAFKLAELHKPGNKEKNTGLIILLSTEDRQYTILTGRGLEGVLPDAICKRIENRCMVPYLKEGEWDKAMISAVLAVKQYTEGDNELHAFTDEEEEDDDAGLGMIVGFLGFGGCMAGVGYLASRQRKKCPKCGKHNYKLADERCFGTVIRNHRKQKHYRRTYICSDCGYTSFKDEYEDIDDGLSNLSRIGGPIIFGTGNSFGRGGFSDGGFGGGFSGGSFGGGSFGGGGASGSF